MKNLFEKYKAGTLSEPELDQLDAFLVQGITYRQDRRRLEALLVQKGMSLTPSVSDAKKDKGKRVLMWKYVVGIAATLALVMGSWMSWSSQTIVVNPSLALSEAYLKADNFSAPQTRMDVRNGENADWIAACEAFDTKNFDKAAQFIAKMPNRNVEQEFFLGQSYLNLAQPDYAKAAESFNRILKNKMGSYEREARWFLALSYQQVGRLAEAHALLESIKQAGGWKAQEATNLLAH